MLSHLKRLDWVLIWSSSALVAIGLVSLYGAGMSSGDFSNFQKQLGFFIAGVFLMLLLSMIDWRALRNDPYLILLGYVAGILALAGIFIFAPEIRGIKRWYRLGDFLIDPVEYIKIILIILLAKYFSIRHTEIYQIRHILLPGIYFIIPILLIFFQPDLGSVLLLSLIWLIMLLVAGIKLRHLLVLFSIAAIFFSFSWTFLLHDYQKERIMSFLEPELDPLGMGWSQLQSKIAIGSGQLTGQGIGKGTQTRHGFLSEPKTDFMFSSLAEELGFAGVFLLFGLFTVLIWRILAIGLESQSNFPRLFSAGIATLFITGLFINVGMNLGFLPIIGLPLPLVSYGGSSLIMTYIGFGILQSIKVRG